MIRSILLAAASVAVTVQPVADRSAELATARREAAQAAARATALSAQAAQERDAAGRAERDEQAMAARVAAAETRLRAARLRVALVDRSLDERRRLLSDQQQPAARLLATLTSLARRPAIAAIAQPGSVDDLVHVRAVLGATLPIIQQRTQGLRDEIARTRALREESLAAGTALRADRAALQAERQRLSALAATHRGRSRALGRGALSASDRALAMGEAARDLVDQMADDDRRQAVAAELAALPGPPPRPDVDGAISVRSAGAYRLPVTGRLLRGLGELSANGVRSRGLTFAVDRRAVVVAPAGGTVRFAGHFRGYGAIVIIDHGAGWTTLLTGLAATRVRSGQRVRAGVPVGQAERGGEPTITVELRRQGQPQDIVALLE